MAYLTAEKKQELFGQYGKSNTELLEYLKEVDIERYRAIVKTLNLRK